MLKKHDYNIFSKKELVEFLYKCEKLFNMINTPFDVIIARKMDLVMKQISDTNKYNKKLIEQLEHNKDINIVLQISENHEKWKKLNIEYDKLSKLRFE